MIFWGIANQELAEVTDFFLSRREAELALSEVVSDEPAFADLLSVVSVDLEGDLFKLSLN